MRYCPYCLEKFTKEILGFKCRKTQKIFTRDTWKTWKTQGILPVCPGGLGDGACKNCHGMALRDRVCVKCKSELDSVMVQNDNIQISIIGTQSAGKTIFINMLLYVMRECFGYTAYGKSFLPVKASEASRVDNIVRDMLRGILPRGTTQSQIQPLLYQCGSGEKKDVLTFFDGAGETFADEKMQMPENISPKLEAMLRRYVEVSDGIILLFDPTSIEGINKELAKDRGLLPQLARVTLEAALRGASLTYQRIKEWRYGEAMHFLSRFLPIKINIPCAVVFSKFDLLFSMFADGSRVCEKSNNLDRGGRFDDKDSQIVSEEIRCWLEGNDCITFLNEIESSFKIVRYFGISSLGGSPATESKPKTAYYPHRIADPLLWLMSVNGVL